MYKSKIKSSRVTNYFQTSNLFHMKRVLLFLIVALSLNSNDSFALSAFLSGPDVVCPAPATSTYAVAGLTNGLSTLQKIQISVQGTGNLVTATPVDGESVCTQLSATLVECRNLVNGGSDVFATATASWSSTGSITVEVFNGNGNVRATETINVTFDTAPGSLFIGGPSPVNTIETFTYSALTNPLSHNLTNTSWSISPTFGYTVTAPDQNSRSINFDIEGNYTITVTGTVTTPCGNAITRTASRVIVVDDDDAPIPFMETDGPIIAENDRQIQGADQQLISPNSQPLVNADTNLASARLFPNPVEKNQNIQVILSDEFTAENTLAQFFDSNGRLMKYVSLRDKVTDIALDNFPTGWYVLRLVNSNQSETIKFVVK